jgi:hypothetical protein
MAPCLDNINIFLVLAPSRGSESAAMTGIKVDEKRITSSCTDELIKYTWDDLIDEVDKLLTRAAVRYPQIRRQCVARTSGSTATSPEPDNLTDNLRELAAAANAMQGDSAMADMRAQKPSNSSESSFPRYIIKTLGSGGFETISNTQEWNDLLLRTSREIWADGKLNLIVESVDIRAGEEARDVAESGEVSAKG